MARYYGNMMDRAIQIQAMKDAREGRAMHQKQMQAEDDEELKAKNAMYAENAAKNAFGGIDRNGRDMVLDDGVGEGAAWRPQATGDESEIDTRSWQDAIRQQQMQKANEQTAAFDKVQDGIANIEMMNKQKVELDNQNRSQWLVGLVSSAHRNGGMSDRALSVGASEALGQQIFGVQRLIGLSGKESNLNGSYAVYGAKDDGRGGQTVGVVGVVTPETILKTLDRLGAGDKYNQLRQQLWNDGGFDRYTPEQQARMGVRNPNAISVAGSTTISGNVSKRLFGERNWRPSGVTTTAFSADGSGGITTWHKDWDTGETWKEEGGTRDPNYRMQKLQEEEMKRTMDHNEEMRKRQRDADISNYYLYDDGHNSADGTMKYRNSATGEVVSVRKGENLRDVLSVYNSDGASSRIANSRLADDLRNMRAISKEEATANQNRINAINTRIRTLKDQYDKEMDPEKKKAIQDEMNRYDGALKTLLNIAGDSTQSQTGVQNASDKDLISMIEDAKRKQAESGRNRVRQTSRTAPKTVATTDYENGASEVKNAETKVETSAKQIEQDNNDDTSNPSAKEAQKKSFDEMSNEERESELSKRQKAAEDEFVKLGGIIDDDGDYRIGNGADLHRHSSKVKITHRGYYTDLKEAIAAQKEANVLAIEEEKRLEKRKRDRASYMMKITREAQEKFTRKKDRDKYISREMERYDMAHSEFSNPNVLSGIDIGLGL